MCVIESPIDHVARPGRLWDPIPHHRHHPDPAKRHPVDLRDMGWSCPGRQSHQVQGVGRVGWLVFGVLCVTCVAVCSG